jgi:hypothetical protein
LVLLLAAECNRGYFLGIVDSRHFQGLKGKKSTTGSDKHDYAWQPLELLAADASRRGIIAAQVRRLGENLECAVLLGLLFQLYKFAADDFVAVFAENAVVCVGHPLGGLRLMLKLFEACLVPQPLGQECRSEHDDNQQHQPLASCEAKIVAHGLGLHNFTARINSVDSVAIENHIAVVVESNRIGASRIHCFDDVERNLFDGGAVRALFYQHCHAKTRDGGEKQ